MSIINMAKNIKELEPKSVLCFKSGSFYHCYGRDAYILSYMFDYKIKTIKESNILSSGFPQNALNKVMARLENKKINYLIIEPRDNYNVNYKMDFKNLNRYNEIYLKANKYVKLVVRINNLSDSLKKDIEKEDTIEKIRRMEEIVYGKKGKV